MPTVMERSGLRTRNRRGDREQRGLEPIRDLVSQGQLQDLVSVQGATAMWEHYETCDGNSFEENKLLLYYMYSPADNKIGPLSIETLALVTGAGRGRVGKLRRILRSSLPELTSNLGDIIPPHGNTGKIPYNKTPDALYAKMVNAVKLFTRANPSSGNLETTTERYSGIAGLIRAMEDEEPEAAKKISRSTRRRIIVADLRERGFAALCSANPDHNVCDICKMWSALVNSLHTRVERMKQQQANSSGGGGGGNIGSSSSSSSFSTSSSSASSSFLSSSSPGSGATGTLDQQIADCEKQAADAQKALDLHMEGHYSIKSHLYRLIHLAKAMRLAEEDASDTEKCHPFRSRDQVGVFHIDDKSSIDDHAVPKQGSGVLNRYNRGCCGFADYIYDTATMIIMDSTKSQKDTDVVINEVVLSLLRSVNGEKHGAPAVVVCVVCLFFSVQCKGWLSD